MIRDEQRENLLQRRMNWRGVIFSRAMDVGMLRHLSGTSSVFKSEHLCLTRFVSVYFKVYC